MDSVTVYPHVGCGWIKPLTLSKDREKRAYETYQYLRKIDDKFDAVAVTGYSATILGSILAHQMNKNIVVVRKSDDNCNSGYHVEGLKHQRVIFVDDCVSTGKTFRRIVDGLGTLECDLIGVIVFNQSVGDKSSDWIEQYKVLCGQDKITELGDALADSPCPAEEPVPDIGSLHEAAEVAL